MVSSVRWLGVGVLMGAVQAATAQAPASLPAVVVTATRLPQAPADIAASIDVVEADVVRLAGPQVNLSEALARVPGVTVLNRQNYAQDLQISSRGFGARSTFGVRGVRLYADGIPLTMPDGQGQASSIDLGTVERIEVLRGPMSVLYGNAAGGVVQVFTEEGPPRPTLSLGWAGGRDGLHRESIKLGGQQGDVNYLIHASRFQTDGFRQHSAAERRQGHARLQWALAGQASLTLVGSMLDMPWVQDPLGLSREDLATQRQHAVDSATLYNTRKDIAHRHLGLVYEQPLAFGELRLMGYTGARAVRQFQAIPPVTQAPSTHAGGVIDFDRRFHGLDARLSWHTRLADRPLSLTGGVNLDEMKEDRRGYENFVGTQLGVQGALRRDEINRARNRDVYLQAQWELSERWQASAGLRHSRVRFSADDRFIAPGNPDDSGGMPFSATSPVVGLMWKPRAGTHLYATVGRSFETPTLSELAYRDSSAVGSGWNTALKASQGLHREIGLKQALARDGLVNLALFQTDTDDEVGVADNSGGRSIFQNVGRTRREGLEAALRWVWGRQWSAFASAAWTRAHYRDAFVSSARGVVSTVSAGRTLPGVPRQTAFIEWQWQPTPAWSLALEGRYQGRLWANDQNSEGVAGSSEWALRLAWQEAWGDWRLKTLARIDNLGDQHRVGSVIVNEGNRRYYEPAPGRSATLGLELTRRF